MARFEIHNPGRMRAEAEAHAGGAMCKPFSVLRMRTATETITIFLAAHEHAWAEGVAAAINAPAPVAVEVAA